MEFREGYLNSNRQQVEYLKPVGTDRHVYVMRCGYCDEQYPAEGDLQAVECPTCDRGTPRVAFSEQEYINALVCEAEDTVSFLGNDRKVERERSTCAALLRSLGIEFTVDELKQGREEPIDVEFRTARFQVREMLDAGRCRNREWKDKLKLRRSASTLEEVLEGYRPSQLVDLDNVIRAVCSALKSKQERYGAGCRELDVVLYVNWHAHLNTKSAPPDLAELERQNWRSVSILFGPYAYVVVTSDNAPEFLRERRGAILSMWNRPGHFSV